MAHDAPDTPGTETPAVRRRSPVIQPGYTFASVTDKIGSIVLTQRFGAGWWAGFLLAFALVLMLLIRPTVRLMSGVN